MNSIIILSGPVGAGKSTVAVELLASSAGPTIYIEGDKFWNFIAKPSPTRSREKNFKMTMTAMMAASVPYALAGYEVILDFSIPPWFLDTALAVAKVKNVPLDFVVLLPSEKVCALRAAERKEGKISDYTAYHDLYLSFNSSDRHLIRNEDIGPTDLASTIREGLDAGKYRL